MPLLRAARRRPHGTAGYQPKAAGGSRKSGPAEPSRAGVKMETICLATA